MIAKIPFPAAIQLAFASVSLAAPGLAAAQTSPAPHGDDAVKVVSTNTTNCVEGTRSIQDVTPQLAFNDFDGHGQIVGAVVYSFSHCLGETRNRWFVQASAAHVDEAGFRANAALVGLGLELHPFADRANLALLPVVRIGREDFHPSGGSTVYDAAVTVSDVVPLTYQTRQIGDRKVRIAATQFEWAARTEYTNRDFSGPGLVDPHNEAVTFFGSVGFDGAVGRSNWRWKGALAYQTLPGPRQGFASLGLSFRPVNAAYTSYDWNFSISAQAGDGRFRGVLIGITRRFGR
jgi:hypothetical protein